VDGAVVGMVQSRRSLRFPLKPGEGLRVFGNLFGQELQGNEAMQPNIFGLIDHPHPATAQLLDDSVVRNGLPDHWGESYVTEVCEVNESPRIVKAKEKVPLHLQAESHFRDRGMGARGEGAAGPKTNRIMYLILRPDYAAICAAGVMAGNAC
jgi:hypothetical protein